MRTSVALVDCRHFYCACEQLFNPGLRGRGVVVLSNGDGIVVALSPEAKALGVKRGTPFFLLRKLVNQGAIYALSSNYTLYADISRRVQSVIEQIVPSYHIYSLDEVFLELEDYSDTQQLGRYIRDSIYQKVGIVVGVGIGPNATLAKVAQYAAKTYQRQCQGVAVLDARYKWQWLYQRMSVEDVWGVGRALMKHLNRLGVVTAADLALQDVGFIRKRFGSLLADTVLELNGYRKVSIAEPPESNQHQIISSHTFGEAVSQAQLFEPVAEHITKACEKLRRQRKVAGCCIVFFRTNPYRLEGPQLSHGITLRLAVPSADTTQWLRQARGALTAFFANRPKPYLLQKAGVILGDLKHEAATQYELFTSSDKLGSSLSALEVMDRINQRFGQGSIGLSSARALSGYEWRVKRERLSPRYTTQWSELPQVFCR